MKIQGVLLGTIEEQITGGDPNPIDPNLIQLSNEVPVSIEFERERTVGKTTKVWREDGRILFRADVDEFMDFVVRHNRTAANAGALAKAAAIGFLNTAELAYTLETKDDQGYTVKGGTLFEVGLTDENENRNQPPFEVIDDATL